MPFLFCAAGLLQRPGGAYPQPLYANCSPPGRKKFSPRQNRPVSLERTLGRALQQVGGGYAQALQALYEQMGIPCLTVSGQWNGENHMWNLVWLDGEWRYCDATSDRGRSEFGFGCYRVTAENLWGHTWDQDWIVRLTSGLKV